MSDGLVVDNQALLDMLAGNQYVTYVMRSAIDADGLRVWIPRYCFHDLLDTDDTMALLVAGMARIRRGRITIGPDDPAYLRAIRTYGETTKCYDPYIASAALDAINLQWPVLSRMDNNYERHDVEVIGYEH